MNTVHCKINFRKKKIKKNQIKLGKIFEKIKFSKMKISKINFVENNVLNAKFIALHYLKMQRQCIYTSLCV